MPRGESPKPMDELQSGKPNSNETITCIALNGSLPQSQRLKWEEVSRSPEPCRSNAFRHTPRESASWRTKKRSADRARGRHARPCERAMSAEALQGAMRSSGGMSCKMGSSELVQSHL